VLQKVNGRGEACHFQRDQILLARPVKPKSPPGPPLNIIYLKFSGRGLCYVVFNHPDLKLSFPGQSDQESRRL